MKATARANVLFLGTILFVAGCATSAKYDPFVVSKEAIRGSVKTIAVFHLKNHNPVEAEFDDLIETRLREGGFSVVGPDQVKPVADKAMQALGGLYDPQTGLEDKAKSGIYWQNVLQEIKTNLNVDAILTFDVVLRSVKFYGDRVEWDGASEGIYMHYGLADALFTNGVNYGTTSAFSLKVILSDLQHRNLFVNYGGIQLESKLSRPPNAFAQEEFQPVPESQLFSDTNSIQGAVTVALNPLTK